MSEHRARLLRSKHTDSLPTYLKELKKSKLVTLSFIPEHRNIKSSTPESSTPSPTTATDPTKNMTGLKQPLITDFNGASRKNNSNYGAKHSNDSVKSKSKPTPPKSSSGTKRKVDTSTTTSNFKRSKNIGPVMETKLLRHPPRNVRSRSRSSSASSRTPPTRTTLGKTHQFKKSKEERISSQQVMNTPKLRFKLFPDFSEDLMTLNNYKIENEDESIDYIETDFIESSTNICKMLKYYRELYKSIIAKRKQLEKERKLKNEKLVLNSAEKKINNSVEETGDSSLEILS